MKKRIVNILNGIADTIFPSIDNSIKNTNDGREINRARLTSAILTWLFVLAVLLDWITLQDIIGILKVLIPVI